MLFSRDGRYEMDVETRISVGTRVNGALVALMRRRNISTAIPRLVGIGWPRLASLGIQRKAKLSKVIASKIFSFPTNSPNSRGLIESRH